MVLVRNECNSIHAVSYITLKFILSVRLNFLLVGLRYPPHFDFRKSKKGKQEKMTGKVSETLQNDCLACCLHKTLGKIHYNDNRNN